jgi:AraC-like DNA-binding protein
MSWQVADLAVRTDQAGVKGDDPQNPIWGFSGYRVDRARSWALISAEVISRDAGQSTWQSDRHRIVYALTDIPGTVQSEGRSAEPYGLHREKVAFRPAKGVVRADLPMPVRIIQILQRPETYHAFACDLVRGGAVSLEPRGNVDSPLISRIALTLADDIEGGVLDHVFADALNTALAVQVIRQFVEPGAINLIPSNGLSRERLRRVRDYIDAHLGESLTLSDIAEVACLSSYHLSRSFKLATGITLHRYVLSRRIERAKELLLRTDMPLVEVAWKIGFDSQASFTTQFRREVGVTPGRMRTGQA